MSVRVVVSGSLTAAALLLAGCSTTSGSNPFVDSAPTPPMTTATVPGTTSGPLVQADLPAPSDLGPEWSYRTDPGSVEDGYIGSGEPAIARDPADVVAALSPLGCRPADLPLPIHALEVTYRAGRTPGVGLLLDFADEGTAHRFFTMHADALRTCHRESRIDGRLVVDDNRTLVSIRRERLPGAPTWTEGIHLDGRRALFVAAAEAKPSAVLRAVGED